MNLDSLPDIKPLYWLPNDPLAENVLIPAFRISRTVDCMVGFFSSKILASLAPGLASYISGTGHSFRLIISPFLSVEDMNAINKGIKSIGSVAEESFKHLMNIEDSLQKHTLECLSWLLSENRIEIKIAIMKDGLFHPKVWLFSDYENTLAIHGSSNATHSGIEKNIEQVTIAKSWEGHSQEYITSQFDEKFQKLWKNLDDGCEVIDLPEAIKLDILKTYPPLFPPSESDFKELYENSKSDRENINLDDIVSKPIFSIPQELEYQKGDYAHQGKAINAWCNNNYNGILEMATGSGKTITAMICAYKLYETKKPLLIIVSAPYKPLIDQWCQEIEPFGLKPINLSASGNASSRSSELARIRRRIRSKISDVEAIVVTHSTLCSKDFIKDIMRFDCEKLLIGDEAHNLGAEGFIKNPPEFIKYRLGLSATPVRQYDTEGTEALSAFFGPIVFQFTLKDAIGVCLVEYDYYVHFARLSSEEMDDWYILTDKIKKASWREEDESPDEYLSNLLRKRRKILESSKNKIAELQKVLQQEKINNLRYTLIYTSDKDPEQLKEVNEILRENGALFHQLTHEETGNREKTASIIKSFQEGNLGILTAKRVLDEGVNIPQIQKAFILASTTVERQWIQRRGRLLRTCKDIGKTHSEIHDFVALPEKTDNIDADGRKLIESELLRVKEFACLARNYGKSGKLMNSMHELTKMAHF